MKTLLPVLSLLLLIGCQEYNFTDQSRSYGEPTATSIDNGIITDEFRAIHLDPVDILFAIDDSCSMGDDQDELAARIPGLGNGLLAHDMNYRVAFTQATIGSYGELTPLPTDQGYQYWLTPNTKAKEDLFVYGATPGTSGHGAESALYASWATIETSETGQFFLRSNSSFHIIALSDEPDQASALSLYSETSYPQVAAAAKEIDPPHKYIQWLDDLRRDSTFSIIQAGTLEQPTYRRVARQTGGYIMDIEKIKQQAVKELKEEDFERAVRKYKITFLPR